MPVLKPIRGIRLNKSHPLARGLVGYWLLNEGSGNKVFDLSGNGNTGTFQGTAPSWTSGKFGSAVLLPGTDEYISLGTLINMAGWTELTVVGWLNPVSGAANDHVLIGNWDSTTASILVRIDMSSGNLDVFLAEEADTSIGGDTGASITFNNWHFVGMTWRAGDKLQPYIDGIAQGTTYASSAAMDATASPILCIGRRDPNHGNKLKGPIDNICLYNRCLSASEIALFYREPFCMFDRASNVARLSSLVAPQIVELAGTSAALSSLSAIAKVSRKVGGTIVGTSNVDGSLGIIGGQIVELAGTIAGRSNVNGSLGIMGESPPEMERSWLTEALFNGMTANAFKLGTSLSLGWFWVRVTGCSVLYRGAGMGDIGGVDFANILTVSEQDAREISPPSYIPHDGSPNGASTYFYVVRRFNNCGYQEHTLAAAVKVSIKSNGELAEPQPNNIFSSKVEQVASNKIRLAWFYCPLEQGSRPICFNVYYDDRTGQIDFENPLNTAIIEYKGRKFYSFQSSALEAGDGADEHLFAIRAEDAGGIENISLARLKIQLDTLNPDAIDILRAEAV